ncbi:MAG: hypothetical protein CMN33_07165 [Saprospirales bacterium]|nr:hypothetical protein [Saprospirales bacterium]
MFLGLLVLITALTISGIAIYYSVAGLVAIFAAAAVPIIIMGSALEIGKLVTAVWLHRYWKQAAWWLRSYLALAVVVLMLITSMGIFGFLSKAHIEQTSASEESIARIESIETETVRLQKIIKRAENKITTLESSGTGSDTNIQNQIDKEQDRIDKAFDRIKPAIEQQNKIITDARGTDATRTKPYEDQLTSITAEILRLETSAKEYETKIENLDTDNSGVEPLLAQIDALEEEIIRVTNQLQSTEKGEIRAGQAIIGVSSDGLFGGNTRTALAKWVQGQRDRITQIQGEVATVRAEATKTVKMERFRLAGVVKDIREVQIPALKDRELVMLGKIDNVRQTESPSIATARDEIQRLRTSAEAQVVKSQELIQRLQTQLANNDNAQEIQTAIDEQEERVRTASNEIELLNDNRIELESEYRKLEAEVGPIKYIAEFVYGEQADKNLLEEAVRWVIITIIFVFDPLAVLLLIASQYTFEWRHTRKDDDGERLRREYEQARAQKIVDNMPPNNDPVETHQEEETEYQDVDQETLDKEFQDQTREWQELYDEVEQPVEKKDESSDDSKKLTKEELDALDDDLDWKHAKQQWKVDNPDDSIKSYKDWYLSGKIDKLPWESYVPKKKRPYLMKENGQQKKGTAVE